MHFEPIYLHYCTIKNILDSLYIKMKAIKLSILAVIKLPITITKRLLGVFGAK
jgi:hypothetical protein